MQLSSVVKTSRWILTGLIALSVAGLVLRLAGASGSHFQFAKLGSACFVLLAVASGALATSYGRVILIALLCCAAGDVLGPRNFLMGVAAFLLGHLMFTTAFFMRGISGRRLIVTLPFVLASTILILPWLYPHVSASDRLLVLAYIAAISIMLIVAGGASAHPTGRLILIAAALFYVSDIFVARWKYVSQDQFNGIFCYPLYYAACTCFAWTALLHAKAEATLPAPRRPETRDPRPETRVSS
jgi:uncharacterized membrane protein YhhN